MNPNKILKSFKPNKPILSLLSIEVLIGVLGEMMPDGLKKKIEVLISINLGGYIEEIWMAVFGVTVLVFLWLSLRREKSDSVEKVEPTNLFENERNEIIKGLEERYTNRLKNKLDERIAINLGLKYTTLGTDEEFADTYFVQDAKDEKDIKSKLVEVLEKHSHLLIVGEPGAGKTTLLLELAIELLKQAKENESLPFPIILNLASWRGDRDFAEWLKDGLVNGDGFSKKLANDIIEKRQILPFLDGLDEISNSNLRSDCFRKLGEFLPKYNPQKIVICSRIDEYKEAKIDAPVRAEILVKPLSLRQVTKLLRDRKNSKIEFDELPTSPTSAGNMLRWIEKSDAAGKVFCNPFYFNLASQLLASTNLQTEIPQEESEIKHYFVKNFVDSSLAKTSKRFSSRDKNEYWLSWLASKLNKFDVIAFELSSFQPEFLRYNVIFFLIAFFPYSLFYAFVFGLPITFFSLIRGLILGVFCGILGGVFTFFHFFILDGFKPTDVHQWKLSNLFYLENWRLIYIGSFGGFFLSLFLTVEFISDKDFSRLVDSKTFLIYIGIILAGMGAGLIAGLLEAVSTVIYYSKILNPYQRLKGGIVFSLIKWSLILSKIIFILFFFKEESFSFVLILSLGGFLIGLIFGFCFSHFYRHLALRLCFYLEGSMPLRYVDFLNYATDLRILERDDGQWRFRHKILQDYFANLELEKF